MSDAERGVFRRFLLAPPFGYVLNVNCLFYVDEDEVGDVTDLPVETEYVDERGRLLSLATDELGNTFEWVTDEKSGTLGARIIQAAD